ncbi:MAG: P-loop containing nucleoside triphosphate hydrolase protein [Benniella sp.]|nr:MAG: P-loop containing nucleoside triphosphate hydrolase protein [Benniella sp.]
MTAWIESNQNEAASSFEGMGLNPDLLQSMRGYGFLQPTKLQQDALSFLVNGRDVIIDAPVRSGKTATTCISILQRVDTSNQQCQALILAPFPKAVLRTQKVILALGGYDVQCHACIDHAELREDTVRLGKCPPIVIGTPTYVQEIIRYGVLATDDIHLFVLDGVDEMLSDGLESVLREFFQYIPRNAQVVLLLSNTSMELKGIAKKFLRDPVSVVHGYEESLPDDCEAVAGSLHGFEVKLCEIESNWNEDIDNFDKIGLDYSLLRGIYTYGLQHPWAVQQRAMMPILIGLDVIMLASPMVGRTTAIMIPLIQNLKSHVSQCQAVVLVPVYEAIRQIQKFVLALSEFKKVRCHGCIGDNRLQEDTAHPCGPLVVVGTPDLVQDMFESGTLKPEFIKTLVMDEADEMFLRGYKGTIGEILRKVDCSTQFVLSTTTMPKEVMETTSEFMPEPIRIVVTDESRLQGIKQFHVSVVGEEWKLDTLCDLYETLTITQVVIFCNTRKKVDWLTKKLTTREFTVSAIHSGIDEKERELAMEVFGSGSSRVLIATDFLTRGIDVRHVSVVINYDLPVRKEGYIRRIGLQDRFGRKGIALNFVTNEDRPMLKRIEQFYSIKIPEIPMNVAHI